MLKLFPASFLAIVTAAEVPQVATWEKYGVLGLLLMVIVAAGAAIWKSDGKRDEEQRAWIRSMSDEHVRVIRMTAEAMTKMADSQQQLSNDMMQLSKDLISAAHPCLLDAEQIRRILKG